MITTHEKIRVESGFQNRFNRVSFLNSPGVSTSTFYVDTDDIVKIVPNFNTGNTYAGISDVAVWGGLSGVVGSSRYTVSGIDYEIGSITLNAVPDTGSSIVVDFASSNVANYEVENVRLQAESIVNQKLSTCYSLPLTPNPSSIVSMTTRLGAALLLIRDYGVGARSTSKDGYMLYEQLMGKNQAAYSDTGMGVLEVGEIGMICRQGYQLVDDNGIVIPRNDETNIDSTVSYVDGGRVAGRLHNITDENMRFKKPQIDADSEQVGSGYDGYIKQQG